MPYKLPLKPDYHIQKQFRQFAGIDRSIWNWAIAFCRQLNTMSVEPTLALIQDAFKNQYCKSNPWIIDILSNPIIKRLSQKAYDSAFKAFTHNKKTRFKRKADNVSSFYLHPNLFFLSKDNLRISGLDSTLAVDMPFELSDIILDARILKQNHHWYLVFNTNNPDIHQARILEKLDKFQKAKAVPKRFLNMKLSIQWMDGVTHSHQFLPSLLRICHELEHYTQRIYPVYLLRNLEFTRAEQSGIFLDYSLLSSPIEQIAGTVSHEWAHCYYGHCFYISDNATSRNIETIADIFSAEYMAKYGYNIDPMCQFFLEAPDEGYPTHPKGRDRARNMLLTYERAKRNQRILADMQQQIDSKNGNETKPLRLAHQP